MDIMPLQKMGCQRGALGMRRHLGVDGCAVLTNLGRDVDIVEQTHAVHSLNVFLCLAFTVHLQAPAASH